MKFVTNFTSSKTKHQVCFLITKRPQSHRTVFFLVTNKLSSRTRGGQAESWAVHMVRERARVHGDEDGIGQVGEDDGESSRRSVRRVRVNDSKESRLGGRSDTCRHRRFDRFGLKTGESVTSCGNVREGLIGLASKSGADMARSRSGQRAHDVIAKLASRRSEVVKTACLFGAPVKRWTTLLLRELLL